MPPSFPLNQRVGATLTFSVNENARVNVVRNSSYTLTLHEAETSTGQRVASLPPINFVIAVYPRRCSDPNAVILSQRASECVCKEHYYMSPPGSYDCTPCPPGHSAAPASMRASDCIATCVNGEYIISDGARTGCQCASGRELVSGVCVCGKNKFGDGITCADCPLPDQTSDAGSTQESDCSVPFGYVTVIITFNAMPEQLPDSSLVSGVAGALEISEGLVNVSKVLRYVSSLRRSSSRRNLLQSQQPWTDVTIRIEAASSDMASRLVEQLGKLMDDGVLSSAFRAQNLPEFIVVSRPQIDTVEPRDANGDGNGQSGQRQRLSNDVIIVLATVIPFLTIVCCILIWCVATGKYRRTLFKNQAANREPSNRLLQPGSSMEGLDSPRLDPEGGSGRRDELVSGEAKDGEGIMLDIQAEEGIWEPMGDAPISSQTSPAGVSKPSPDPLIMDRRSASPAEPELPAGNSSGKEEFSPYKGYTLWEEPAQSKETEHPVTPSPLAIQPPAVSPVSSRESVDSSALLPSQGSSPLKPPTPFKAPEGLQVGSGFLPQGEILLDLPAAPLSASAADGAVVSSVELMFVDNVSSPSQRLSAPATPFDFETRGKTLHPPRSPRLSVSPVSLGDQAKAADVETTIRGGALHQVTGKGSPRRPPRSPRVVYTSPRVILPPARPPRASPHTDDSNLEPHSALSSPRVDFATESPGRIFSAGVLGEQTAAGVGGIDVSPSGAQSLAEPPPPPGAVPPRPSDSALRAVQEAPRPPIRGLLKQWISEDLFEEGKEAVQTDDRGDDTGAALV